MYYRCWSWLLINIWVLSRITTFMRWDCVNKPFMNGSKATFLLLQKTRGLFYFQALRITRPVMLSKIALPKWKGMKETKHCVTTQIRHFQYLDDFPHFQVIIQIFINFFVCSSTNSLKTSRIFDTLTESKVFIFFP